VSGHTTMAAFYRYVNTDTDSVFRAAAALDALNLESLTTLPEETQTTTASELIN